MKDRKKNFFKLLAIFIILALIIINSKTISAPLRIKSMDLGACFLEPVQSTARFLKRLVPFSSLRAENALLRRQIELVSRQLEETKVVDDENRRLKDLLNFRKSLPFTTVPAETIGRDPSNWSNSLIIDKGLNYGIRPNMAVISTKGLVGRVVEVGRRSSKILLISDPASKVGVLIRRTRDGGILVGRSNGECKMIYIALDSGVKPGDIVMSAGYGSIFPKGILIGRVAGVGKEPGRLYKYAIVRPSEDLSKLEEVLCVK